MGNIKAVDSCAMLGSVDMAGQAAVPGHVLTIKRLLEGVIMPGVGLVGLAGNNLTVIVIAQTNKRFCTLNLL